MNQTQKTKKKFTLKMMLWLLLLSIAEVEERGEKMKTDEFRKKLMIPKSEISEFPEYEV